MRRLALVATLLLAPATAQADDAHRLSWRWARTSPVELGIDGGLVGALVLGSLLDLDGRERWSGGILLDESTRDLLRAGESDGRISARALSDFLLAGAVLQPLADAGYVALLADHNPDVAGQMLALDAGAILLSTTVTYYAKILIGRARPYSRDCGDSEAADGSLCKSGDRYMSFPSGHASLAFTVAGLACAHHGQLALYHSRVADDAACAGMLGLATAIASLRMIGDKHYLSDVVTGAIIGVLSGFVVPTVVHYQRPDPGAAPAPVALSVGGAF